MKVFVYVFQGYDYADVEGAFLVPDDFNPHECHRQWVEECIIPKTGGNRYGKWKSKNYNRTIKSFIDWIREKYESVEFLTYSP